MGVPLAWAKLGLGGYEAMRESQLRGGGGTGRACGAQPAFGVGCSPHPMGWGWIQSHLVGGGVTPSHPLAVPVVPKLSVSLQTTLSPQSTPLPLN